LSYLNGEEELTEEIKGLDINGDEPVENGHALHEVHYYPIELDPIKLEIGLYFICCSSRLLIHNDLLHNGANYDVLYPYWFEPVLCQPLTPMHMNRCPVNGWPFG
jgi:hypothetical protein